MQASRTVFTTAALCFFFAVMHSALHATPANAWGAQGHRVAGTLAEQHLSPSAQRAVASLLGSESLANASTWADRMRSDPSPFWQTTAGPFHYVSPSASGRYRPGDAPPAGDAYTALTDFAAAVRDDSLPLAERQLALRFSIHIVQDLHQPLHAGVRKDRGGNDFKVSFDGNDSNLHRVWDSGLLSAAQRSDREWIAYFDRVFGAAERDAWQETDPLVWIRESAELSRSIYPDSGVLDGRYVERHRETVERRLVQAGVRTAAWLNALFDQSTQKPSDAAPTPTRWERLKQFLKEIVQ